jgi:hypothetical protein
LKILRYIIKTKEFCQITLTEPEIIEGVKNEIASKKEELKGMDNNKNENDVVALLNEAEMSLNNIEKIENLIEDKKSEKQFEKSLAEVL